ncbi:steroid 17-alpha-hydroxylase/17,20 lyase-like [Tubulanus polymorphus]|uniref:steroid 17-alpha-hydroxylase/17,20 lyase-like n=1 Tax=Tubulanus polymorphus TaxID=672921 RepID=UPI003DA3A777
MDPITFALVVGLIAIICMYSKKRKRYNLPPGPKGYPFIGNTLDFDIVGRPIWVHFTNLAKQYGDVFNFKLGYGKPENVIVLNNADTISKAFVHMDKIDNKPKSWSLDFFTDGSRDISNGQPHDLVWKLMRNITATGLRKSLALSDSKVQSATDKGIEVIRKNLDKPFDLKPTLNLMVYNVICDMLFNKQFEADDQEFHNLYRSLDEVNKLFGNVGALEDVIPITQYIPNKYKIPSTRRVIEWFDHMIDFLKKHFYEHVGNFDSEHQTDITDYLIEARENTRKEDPKLAEGFSDRHMVQIISDIFGAGVDTSSHTIYWIMYFLAKYPEVQKKIHAELDEHIGARRLEMADKQQLVYCEAVLYETMRLCPVGPVAIHTAACDVQIEGFDIPKDCQVWGNIYACHYDSRVWDDPESFKPERFIHADGKLVARPKSWLPFSAGRRSCIGENVARQHMFLFYTSLMQKFSIRFPDDSPVKDSPLTSNFLDIPFFCMSKPYDLIISER